MKPEDQTTITSEIPQYHLEADGERVNFAMRSMEEIREKMNGTPDPPHRHSYHTLIWCTAGKAVHRVDFQEYPLRAGEVHWVQPGQVHQLEELEPGAGLVILFNPEFLAYNGIRDSLVMEDPLRDCGHLRIYGGVTEDSALKEIVEKLWNSYKTIGDEHKWEEWGAWLHLLLIRLNRRQDKKPLQHTQWQSGHTLIREFRAELEKNFSRWHKVSQYADTLHITANYLNDVVKEGVGKTAKQLIQDRISLEAKRLALKSSLSNKEVSYLLGFEDPSHFSRFFRRCTGQSFTDFRAGLRKKYS